MIQTIQEKIHKTFIQRHWTLSLAESCTGGALAASLTRLPGCSSYFSGSIVAYTNSLKINLLGVHPSIIKERGAVSAEVVQQMAEGVRYLTSSDYSLAVSGIAGPEGGTPEKPVGTIWAAVASQSKPIHVWSFHLSGNREQIIMQTVDVLLNELWLLIKNS